MQKPETSGLTPRHTGLRLLMDKMKIETLNKTRDLGANLNEMDKDGKDPSCTCSEREPREFEPRKFLHDRCVKHITPIERHTCLFKQERIIYKLNWFTTVLVLLMICSFMGLGILFIFLNL